MIHRFFYTILLVVAGTWVMGQAGYEIKVKINDYDEDILVLGYQYGGKQYIRDTASVSSTGEFVFQGEEPLEEGIYLLVMQPNNDFVQFMADSENQKFRISFDASQEQRMSSMKIKSSPLNQSYYDYLSYLDSKVPIKKALQERYEEVKDQEVEVAKVRADMKAIDDEVRGHHEMLAEKYAENLLGRLIKARLDPVIPEFTGEDKDMERYLWYKSHYFDNIDLSDEGLLRTGAMFNKVDYYMNQLTPQIPDSVNLSLDYILEATKGSNNFKFFLIHYLREYANSKIVGMDAVYVHLVEKYYATGQADWVSEEQLAKIVDNAKVLKPILIGKTAPNITLRQKDNTPLALHDLDVPYTVMFFWDPECGHCKKSMPDMIAFHDAYKSKGVEVLGICTKIGEEEEMKKCWDTVEEKEMGRWINLSDQYLRSNYKEIYNIKSTPRIFVLDKDKKIIMKGIGADQLSEVMDQLILEEQERLIEKSGE